MWEFSLAVSSLFRAILLTSITFTQDYSIEFIIVNPPAVKKSYRLKSS